MDPTRLTIASALPLLTAAEFTPGDLVDACLAQINRLNPGLNAFIRVCKDVAASEASGATSYPKDKQSPLFGIPLAIKDLYDLAGYPTTAGTTFFTDLVVEGDAAVVGRLKAAGALILGKTNTHEIAYGVTGLNPQFGDCRNPWDPTRIPGGSSSGSAVAVATGMCLGALGTDTGGSIRIPAALCGVVGLKPTFGRVSLRGVFPLSWNLDHAGPITRTVRDAAILLQVIAGFDPLDPGSIDLPVEDYFSRLESGIKGWRVAAAAGEYFEQLDPEVAAAYAEALRGISDLGATVNRLDMSFLREAALANGQMIGADAAAFHRERLQTNPSGFGTDVRQRLEIGPDYALARRRQAEMRRRMELFFEDYDLLLTPTVPIPAPPIEGTDAIEQARRLTRFTAPFNLTGLPAISLPCGLTSSGLPVGLQIISKPWGEAKVLRAGHAYEQSTTWHEKPPPGA